MTVACIDPKTGKFVEPTPATLERATPTQRAAIDAMREAMKAMEIADAHVKESVAAREAWALDLNAAQIWERKHPSGMTRIQATREWINSTR